MSKCTYHRPSLLTLVFLQVILLPLSTHAQRDSLNVSRQRRPKNEESPHFLVYTTVEVMPFYKNTASIVTSFPYVSTDTTTGITSYGTFKIPNRAPFSKFPVFTNLVSEIDYKKDCYRFQFIIACNYFNKTRSGGGCSIGYGHTFEQKTGKSKCFITPFLGLSSLEFTYSVGSIDNTNKYVRALGYTFNPTYTVTHHGSSPYSGPPRKEKYQSRSISAEYDMLYYQLRPEITIANDRRKKFFWSAHAGWLVSFYNQSNLSLGHGGGEGKEVRFNNSDLTVISNNQRIHTFPYKVNGLLAGISFGFNLDKSAWKKDSKEIRKRPRI